jgi:acyl-CoA thioester hydrolase
MTEPFRAEQRVLYGDTDSMGVAYYANYLRWFEIGRTELFRRVGSTYRSLEEQGCYLPVYEAYCRYHNPARYDDIIRIETTFGHTVHVCTDKDGKVLKPPIELKQLLKEMEEKQGSTGNR